MGFSPSAEFGGVPSGAYGCSVTAFVGWALKHTAFATELYLMNPQLDIRNLLVPWSPLQWKVDSLSKQFDLDDSVARQICELFVGDRDVFNRYSKIYDSPFPIFVPAARHHVHFSVVGAQVLPYDLLRRRLFEKYPYDYSRNLNERESWFREDLRWMLPMKRIHFADNEIVIKKDGKIVTDIDALVLVKATGTLAVFQLKWQKSYGGDLNERRNLISNLVPSANRWIQLVHNWLSENGPQALVTLAKFAGEGTEVRRVVYFVLGRHHCRFSKSEVDDRAVWCNWAQFVRAMDTIGVTTDPILALEEYFKKNAGESSVAVEYRVNSFQLRGFTVETHCRL